MNQKTKYRYMEIDGAIPVEEESTASGIGKTRLAFWQH
jgi:hypothetical protein